MAARVQMEQRRSWTPSLVKVQENRKVVKNVVSLDSLIKVEL